MLQVDPHPHRRESMSSIWQPLVRARYRFGGRRRTVTEAMADVPAPRDLTYALGRADLERLIAGLADLPGADSVRPDTPARLEAALAVAIVRANGCGTPLVTRRPAGLYTPETWQIVVTGADDPTRLALEHAIHGEEPG